MPMHGRLSTGALAVLAVVTFVDAPRALAQAQPDAAQIAGRRALLELAERARARGDHREALGAATRAAAIEMTPSVRLFIAREQLDLGQFAESAGNAELCARDAERDAQLRMRAEIARDCADVRAQVRARAATLILRVDPALAGAGALQVLVNGAPVSREALDLPRLVPAGAVAVDASADGRVPSHVELTLTAGAEREVSLSLEPAVAAVAPSAPAPLPTAAPVPAPAPAIAPAPRRSVAGPAVLMGAGGAALVVGAVMLGLRVRALDGCDIVDAHVECTTVAQVEAAKSAWAYNAGMWAGFGAGAALVAGGAAWLLAPRAEREPRAGALRFSPTAGGGSVLGWF